jgi:mono/diheme cytochrome c family protein
MRRASLLVMVAVVLAAPARAQDPDRGRALYETHCGGCHYERVHQRPQARWQVKSLADLRLEVVRWAAQVKRPFGVEDLDDIAAYLDRSHYKFEK